mgnify:CR=1 FL=1
MEPQALVAIGSLIVALIAVALGLKLPTYAKVAGAGVGLSLAWIATAVVLDLPLDTGLGGSLGLAIGYTGFALIAHTIRRLVSAGMGRMRG